MYDYYILIIGGCGFDELQSGDEVEFMTVYSHKAKKDSAIYVKKLRLVDLHDCILSYMTYRCPIKP